MRVLVDHSWPLQDGITLECETENGQPVILKIAGGPGSASHLVRELRAHDEVLSPCDPQGRRRSGLGPGFPTLIRADAGHRILAIGFLPGRLVEGADAESDPAVYAEAGRLLRIFHDALPGETSLGYPERRLAQIERDLANGHELIDAAQHRQATRIVADAAPVPEIVVPTHGDVQPRNWLHLPGRGSAGVSLIDFGRYGRRPWYTDLVRLEHQQFMGHPELREAFVAGMGRSPDPGAEDDLGEGWNLENLMQSLATVVWATGIGDLRFADHGRSMLERTLRSW